MSLHGTVTILFSDVKGSTVMRTSKGDDAAHLSLSAHDEIVQGQIAKYDGKEIKATGTDSWLRLGRYGRRCPAPSVSSRHSRHHRCVYASD